MELLRNLKKIQFYELSKKGYPFKTFFYKIEIRLTIILL